MGDDIGIPHFNRLTAREPAEKERYAFKILAVILTIDEARRLGVRSERSIGLVSPEASTHSSAVGTGLVILPSRLVV
jgi:hypothetical protein